MLLKRVMRGKTTLKQTEALKNTDMHGCLEAVVLHILCFHRK